MAQVLLVEDDIEVREMVRDALERSGHEVTEVSDGNAAIELYRGQPADLVITDMVMEGKNGFKVIEELKKISPEVKIIAMTGWGLHILPVAYDLGAQRIFEKPFSLEELLQVVNELVGS